MEEKKELTPFTIEQIEAELGRVKYRQRYSRALVGIVVTLIVVAAVAILAATLVFPVLQTYGGSMMPTLNDGNIVITFKEGGYERGDIVAFYYNNKILVKRVIALPGEWVNMDEDGQVYVNDILLDEPYLQEDAKDIGDCDIELPYQVPEGRVFVMGDHRSVSIDSRNSAIGCVSEEQMVGRLVFRIWPMDSFGPI